MAQPPVSPCQCNDAEDPAERPGRTRREFFAWVGAGLIGLAGAAASVPLVGAFFSTPPRRERAWHAVGTIDDFPVDETVKVEFSDPDAVPWAGPAAQNAAWLRRTGEESFTCFSIYCTHTGCPVSWRSGANLFICPCHGGVFDREGDVVAGPPETPLVRLDVRLRDDQVEILATPVPVTGRAS
jgi:menaquinol-cytochrome c reductase iron-sulfur subunit